MRGWERERVELSDLKNRKPIQIFSIDHPQVDQKMCSIQFFSWPAAGRNFIYPFHEIKLEIKFILRRRKLSLSKIFPSLFPPITRKEIWVFRSSYQRLIEKERKREFSFQKCGIIQVESWLLWIAFVTLKAAENRINNKEKRMIYGF